MHEQSQSFRNLQSFVMLCPISSRDLVVRSGTAQRVAQRHIDLLLTDYFLLASYASDSSTDS
jgi:hypothetical protein